MGQGGRHGGETAHLGSAGGTGREVRLERLPLGSGQRTKGVGRRLVSDLLVNSHNRLYGARTGKDGPPRKGALSGQHAGG